MKEELLSKKKPGLDDLGNSRSTQIAKGAKIKRLGARKVCSGEKAKSVARQRFVSTEEIWHVVYGSPQPSQQKP